MSELYLNPCGPAPLREIIPFPSDLQTREWFLTAKNAEIAKTKPMFCMKAGFIRNFTGIYRIDRINAPVAALDPVYPVYHC